MSPPLFAQRSLAPFRAGPVSLLSGLWQLAQFFVKRSLPRSYCALSACPREAEVERSSRKAKAACRRPAELFEILDGSGIPDDLGTHHGRSARRKNSRRGIRRK